MDIGCEMEGLGTNSGFWTGPYCIILMSELPHLRLTGIAVSNKGTRHR